MWRRYEEFYEAYAGLHEKYFPSHHSIRYTRLHSLRRLKKLHKKDGGGAQNGTSSFSLATSNSLSLGGGSASSNGSLQGGGGIMESTTAADFNDQSAEFLEMPFLQKLQVRSLLPTACAATNHHSPV